MNKRIDMETSKVAPSVYEQILNQKVNKSKEERFDEMVSENLDEDFFTQRTADLTYNNIKGITQEEIDHLFKDEASKKMANNLRLATTFTQDDNLSNALFNTVAGKPFDTGYQFLADRYKDKSSFLSPNNSLSDLLERTIQNKASGDKKLTDQVSDAQLNEILTAVNSFNFMSVLTKSTRELNDQHKDDEYSFLYNDYALQYEQLMQQYENKRFENMGMINQF